MSLSSELREFIFEITAPEVHSSINIIPEHRTPLYGTKSRKRHPAPTPNNARKRPQRSECVKELQKRLKMTVIPPQQLKFEDFQDLYVIWNKYVTKLLNIKDGMQIPTPGCPHYPQFLKNLSSIDFHGAFIQIKLAKCKSHVGFKGIVLREMTNILELLCTDNRIRQIQKTCLFTVYINNVKFNVLGTHLMNKVARRSRRRAKRFMRA